MIPLASATQTSTTDIACQRWQCQVAVVPGTVTQEARRKCQNFVNLHQCNSVSLGGILVIRMRCVDLVDEWWFRAHTVGHTLALVEKPGCHLREAQSCITFTLRVLQKKMCRKEAKKKSIRVKFSFTPQWPHTQDRLTCACNKIILDLFAGEWVAHVDLKPRFENVGGKL